MIVLELCKWLVYGTEFRVFDFSICFYLTAEFHGLCSSGVGITVDGRGSSIQFSIL